MMLQWKENNDGHISDSYDIGLVEIECEFVDGSVDTDGNNNIRNDNFDNKEIVKNNSNVNIANRKNLNLEKKIALKIQEKVLVQVMMLTRAILKIWLRKTQICPSALMKK